MWDFGSKVLVRTNEADTPMQPAHGYAGDVTPSEALDAVRTNERAVIVDVRTLAEWNFVGLPDFGRPVVTIEWNLFPSGKSNPDFLAQLREAEVEDDQPVYFLCRSGARSAAAATAATAAGYSDAFNIAGGFEGDPDADGRRGSVNGWKAEGLPWRQS